MVKGMPLSNISAFPSATIIQVLPGGLAGKESICYAGGLASIPGLGGPPGGGKGCPLQCSGLENSMDSTVHGLTKCRT